MSRRNHSPERTCIGCMTRDSQSLMVRLVAHEGKLVVDRERRLGGRGGYLHPAVECLERFGSGRAREIRSLRVRPGSDRRREIADEIRARLDSRAPLE